MTTTKGATMNTAPISAQYAQAHTEGEVVGPEYHQGVEAGVDFTLRDVVAHGGRITRVRLLQEMGRVDVSYIHASLPDGRTVRVSLAQCPGSTLIPRFKVKATFIEWAKAEGVFAKGLGLLDESNWSVLH